MKTNKFLKSAKAIVRVQCRPLPAPRRLEGLGRQGEAPAFLIRLVGKNFARLLANNRALEPHHD